MKSFAELLDASTAVHGHLCPGQVLGVRMSMFGLSLLGLTDPQGRDRKNIYVIVEIDRCATDAIQSVTGCSLGKRTMKFVDNGIMAATFVHLGTGEAFRITAVEESRERATGYFPEILDKRDRQLKAYTVMPEKELFAVQKVKVEIPPEDLPGKPLRRIQCEQCGDWVQDHREVLQSGRRLCRACCGQGYYSVIDADIQV